MSDQIMDNLATLMGFLVGYSLFAVGIVLAMCGKAPVWGGRAAKASLLALIPTFVVFPPHEGRHMVFVTPAALLTQCALIVITTGAGSRLSALPPHGSLRQATLAPRRLYVARVPHQRWAAVITTVVTMTAALAGALTATSGTTLVRHHGNAIGTASEYPGWPAAAPALVAGGILLVAAWWALREIRDRPRIVEPTDTLLRARDASRVVRATAFGFAVTGSTVLFSIGSRMNGATQHLRGASESAPRSPWDLYQWLAFSLYIPAVALIVVALFALGGSVGSREELTELREQAEVAPLPVDSTSKARS